jgi:hypothetical protein
MVKTYTEGKFVMEICTYQYVPFVMGGETHQPVKTHVEKFERVEIGKGYYGLLVQNPVKNLWHMVQEDCGCIIGTHRDKNTLIESVMQDVKTGDTSVMKEQIEFGKELVKRAREMEPKKFFSMFKNK